MSDVTLIRNHRFNRADSLLLDANVWLYVYGPQRPGDRRTAEYSRALRWILDAQCSVFVDVLTLSEFVNRYARMKFELWKTVSGINQFKAYRRHPVFRAVNAAITAAMRRIIQQAHPIESGLTLIDMQDFLHDYEERSPDFNDQVLAELCRNNGLTLLTHDEDFKDAGIPVITANPRLVAR